MGRQYEILLVEPEVGRAFDPGQVEVGTAASECDRACEAGTAPAQDPKLDLRVGLNPRAFKDSSDVIACLCGAEVLLRERPGPIV